jgi:predicted esterase
VSTSEHRTAVQHLTVQRHARLAVLEPSAPAPACWIVLHGYGQLATFFVRHFAPLVEHGAYVAAPEALNRFYLESPEARVAGGSQRVGATWMTREDREHEIADYVAYLDHVADVALAACAPGATLGVLGFSQGGTTAARWVARGRHRPQALVLWAAQVPDDLTLPQDLAGIALTFVVGRQDPYVSREAVAGVEARLLAGGLPHRMHWYEGGHRLDAAALRKATGIGEGLGEGLG